MNRARLPRTCAALLVLLVVASAHVRAGARRLTIREYVDQLDRLAAAIDMDNAEGRPASVRVDALPDAWRVDGSTQTFEVSTASIRLALRAWTTGHEPSQRQHLVEQLRMLRSGALSFETPPSERHAQRAALNSILSDPAFRDVHGPTWIDALWQRVLGLLVRSLELFLPHSMIPTVGIIVVSAIAGVALLLAGRFVGRMIRRPWAADDAAGDQPASPVLTWPQWLAGAQSAAARGDWRDAMHLVYWCAVAFLEAKGAWRPDRARTPREYLRALPASSADGLALAALTRRFELVWYGAARADEQVYAEALEHLKSIGCPSA
ncbi:MAG TPA: DUF4129 domain-containing protein [Vicinamibacterales bacterium]|jgi:hypothetical protein|nr:DUF4129 domain-containing protein [Vicinamibacterales bacterium]